MERRSDAPQNTSVLWRSVYRLRCSSLVPCDHAARRAGPEASFEPPAGREGIGQYWCRTVWLRYATATWLVAIAPNCLARKHYVVKYA